METEKTEKFEKSGCKNEPLAFNVGYEFLTSENVEKNFKITLSEYVETEEKVLFPLPESLRD